MNYRKQGTQQKSKQVANHSTWQISSTRQAIPSYRNKQIDIQSAPPYRVNESKSLPETQEPTTINTLFQKPPSFGACVGILDFDDVQLNSLCLQKSLQQF